LSCASGLVAGNANPHPGLLRAFMNNPTHAEIRAARSGIHDDLDSLSSRPVNNAAERIERHINGLKLRFSQIPIHPNNPDVKIFHPHQT
jgi:hypothetical protein